MDNNNFKGVYHKYVHSKLLCKCQELNTDTLKRELVRVVLYNSHVPISIHQTFLQEMQDFKLVKLKDKQNVVVVGYGLC